MRIPPARRRPNARNDILRVFAELVARDGYAETSIADVAAALGLSKGTIVHHFSSKLELLEQVHLEYMERRLAEAHYVLASLSTPMSQLAGMVYALLKSHRDDRAATLSFLREIVRFTEDGTMTAVRTQRDTYTGLIHGIVRRGMERGEFRADDPSLITLQIFGMCNYAWTWYRPDGSRSTEAIAQNFVRTLLVGLADPPSISIEDIDSIADQAIGVVNSAPQH